MALIFELEDGKVFGSLPTLPVCLKSYVLVTSKSLGYVQADYRYIKKIGQVVRMIEPKDPAHHWWETAKADGYVSPQTLDTIVILSFPDIGEDLFLLKDFVHVVPICIN